MSPEGTSSTWCVSVLATDNTAPLKQWVQQSLGFRRNLLSSHLPALSFSGQRIWGEVVLVIQDQSQGANSPLRGKRNMVISNVCVHKHTHLLNQWQEAHLKEEPVPTQGPSLAFPSGSWEISFWMVFVQLSEIKPQILGLTECQPCVSPLGIYTKRSVTLHHHL